MWVVIDVKKIICGLDKERFNGKVDAKEKRMFSDGTKFLLNLSQIKRLQNITYN